MFPTFRFTRRQRPVSPCNPGRTSSGRLFLERLEDRTAPATWVNPSGGSWNVPDNWDTRMVPTANDPVTIALPVEINLQGARSARSLSIDVGGVSLTNGSLNLFFGLDVNASFSLTVGLTAQGVSINNGSALSVSGFQGGALDTGSVIGGQTSSLNVAGQVRATDLNGLDRINLGSPFSQLQADTIGGIGTFTVSNGTVAGASIAGVDILEVRGGTISNSTIGVVGSFTLSGGSIVNSAILSSLHCTAQGGRLSNVAIGRDGVLDVGSVANAKVTISGTFRVDGRVWLGHPGSPPIRGELRFSGDTTVIGTGSIALRVGNVFAERRLQTDTLTVRSSVNLILERGTFDEFYTIDYGTARYVFEGPIVVNAPGGSVSLEASTFLGSVRVFNGATLRIVSPINRGVLTAEAGGTLNLGGGPGEYGLITAAVGGLVAFNGLANLNGGRLTLSGAGAFVLGNQGRGGFQNGTVNATNGAMLTCGRDGGLVGGNVTLNGDIEVASTIPGDSFLALGFPLALNGTIRLGDAAGTKSGHVYFSTGISTLEGTATFILGGSTQNLLGRGPYNLPRLTFGPGITIRGKSGVVGDQGTYNYQGIVSADSAGGTIALRGTWTNTGMVQAINGGRITLSGTWTNSGTVRALTGSTVNGGSNPTNFNNGILTGGTWSVGPDSTMRLPTNTNIVTNATRIVLDGPNSNFYRGSTGTANALAGFAVNLAGGYFALENGRQLTTTAAFRNEGTLTVGRDAGFSTNGSYTQADGATAVSGPGGLLYAAAGYAQIGGSVRASADSVVFTTGATIQGGTVQLADGFFFSSDDYVQTAGATALAGAGALFAATIDLRGGSLGGSGYLVGNLVNAARVDVGGAGVAGNLFLVGDYTQTANGVLNLDVGGRAIGTEYDFLHVTGTAQLEGTLNVAMIGGFAAVEGDIFVPLYFESRVGAFAAMNLAPPGPGLVFDATLDDFTLVLLARRS